jgi:hypothetical protein
MKISGIFLPFSDQPNGNNRIYKKENVDVTAYQDKLERGNWFGEFCFYDEQPNNEVNLKNVSHKIEKIEKTDEGIIGTINLLETEKGLLALKLLDDGAKLSIRPRSIGTVDENGVVTIKEIISFDIIDNWNDAFNPLSCRNKRYKFNNEKSKK